MSRATPKVDLNAVIERRWEERQRSLEEVRKKMRVSWRNDPQMLESYFHACVLNWKTYKGDKKNEQSAAKLYGIYKQATKGDCDEPLAYESYTLNGKKWAEWNRLKGTPKEVAKRRFITYLAELDPALIDVMPDEMPPEGFPLDNQGNKICAKCNTTVGCSRPLLDQHKVNLRRQLFEVEELHEINNLRTWVQNALANQRCIWGVHKPITRAQAKQFTEWFSRQENRGFFQYDSNSVMQILKDLISFHFELAYDMQQNKSEYCVDDINKQVLKVNNMTRFYFEFTGHEFVFEAPCTRDNEICNERRKAERGVNHTHPIELEPPTVDYTPYSEAVELRQQCISLGLDPRTGVQKDVKKRCEIYRQRIEEHLERTKRAQAAKKKNIQRHLLHKEENKLIKENSSSLLIKQMLHACDEVDLNKIMHLAKRGCDCNVETTRGVRPLICHLLSCGTQDQFEALLKFGADINEVNKHGVNPLILACRGKDIKMIHLLMKHGADEVKNDGKIFGNRISLHHCVIHCSEEEAKVLTEYVKEGGDDELRLIRFLDYQDDNGDSPLMLAAKLRNGLMCKLLLMLGANPSIRNNQKRNASYIARHAGWGELADWLDKKISAGVAMVETVADIQFEKSQRFGHMQLMELLRKFSKIFLQFLQGQTTVSLIDTPSKVRTHIRVHGEDGIQEITTISNRYFYYVVLEKFTENEATQKIFAELKTLVQQMITLLSQGSVYPNLECKQPLPFTALMCATVLNDMRSMKIMCRQGCDPNYCNRNGTTAMMIASQLNNVNCIAELFELGGSIEKFDNEGFSCLAYANSFPTPGILSKSSVNVLLDGDNEVTKRYNAEEVLKLATQMTPSEVKKMIAKNLAMSAHSSQMRQLHTLQLLEKNGLSHIESIEHLLEHVTSLQWRNEDGSVTVDGTKYTSESLNSSISVDSDSVLSADLMDEEDDKDKPNSETDEKKHKSKSKMRCPICTLPIPCNHFHREDTLQSYLDKKAKNPGQKILLSSVAMAANKDSRTKKYFENLSRAVIEEAKLDRSVNRNLEFLQYAKNREVPPQPQLTNEPTAESDDSAEEARLKKRRSDLAEISRAMSIGRSTSSQKSSRPSTTSSSQREGREGSGGGVLKSVLRKNHKKKYKPHLRVIRFMIDDELTPGGKDENDNETQLITNYEEALNTEALVAAEEAIANEQALVIIPSTDLILPPDQDISIITQPGVLNKAQQEIAMTTFATGEFNEKAKLLQMKIAPNPVDPKTRDLFMFDKASERNGKVIPLLKTSSLQSDLTAVFAPANLQTTNSTNDIQLSGWLFVGAYPINLGPKPADLLLTLSIYLDCLNELNEKMFDSLIKNPKLIKSTINIRNWTSDSGRCTYCSFGYIRSSDFLELENACLSCAYRKKMYTNFVYTIPRDHRNDKLDEWPFHLSQAIVGDNLSASLSLDIVDTKGHYHHQLALIVLDPNNPTNSSTEGQSVQDYKNSFFVSKNNSTSNKKPGTEDLSSTVEVSTLLSEVTFDTLSTQSSNYREDEVTHGPRELFLIPRMLAMRRYDNVEQLVHIALAKDLYKGDEHAIYFIDLMTLQAELYKVTGYWYLALGILLDAVDWIISRLGLLDVRVIKVIVNVCSTLRAMKLSTQASAYLTNIIALVEPHHMNDSKAQFISDLEEHNRVAEVIETNYHKYFDELCAKNRQSERMIHSQWEVVGGLRGLITFLYQCDSTALQAKRWFIDYCTKKSSTIGEYAQYCVDYFIILRCYHPEAVYYLLLVLVQKFVSNKSSAIHRIFVEQATRHEKSILKGFLEVGTHLDCKFFLKVVASICQYLTAEYASFICTYSRKDEWLIGDNFPLFLHLITVRIQNKWRVYRARKKVAGLKSQ